MKGLGNMGEEVGGGAASEPPSSTLLRGICGVNMAMTHCMTLVLG